MLAGFGDIITLSSVKDHSVFFQGCENLMENFGAGFPMNTKACVTSSFAILFQIDHAVFFPD